MKEVLKFSLEPRDIRTLQRGTLCHEREYEPHVLMIPHNGSFYVNHPSARKGSNTLSIYLPESVIDDISKGFRFADSNVEVEYKGGNNGKS